MFRVLFAALLACGLSLSPSVFAAGARMDAEIDHLLAFVGASGCTFTRNGESHPATEARDHLAMKYDRGRVFVGSTAQFIDRIASRSYLSGDVYRVQCPGQPVQPTGDWLRAELARWRASQPRP